MEKQITYVLQYKNSQDRWVNWGYSTEDKEAITNKLKFVRLSRKKLKLKLRIYKVISE